ncbi:MAG: sugar transferase [Candidatus Binatia bacterium]
MKRIFDITAATLGLLVLAPIFAAVALLIRLDSRGSILFKQERIGKGFRPFRIYKFRTMAQDAPARGALVTAGEDPRITRVGRFLRHTKIDELPQLWNVLKGDMTLVGPRPEVRQYVELFRADYEEILKVRPGLTDLASLKYRDEAAILGRADNPEREYIGRLLPDKIRLGKEYVRRASLLLDLSLIFRTVLKLFASRSVG